MTDYDMPWQPYVRNAQALYSLRCALIKRRFELAKAKRHAAWVADCAAFGGKFVMVNGEAQFSTTGRWVTWSKNEKGQYVRLTATTRDLYAGKVQS